MIFPAPISYLAYSESPSSRFIHTTGGFPPLLSPRANHAFAAAVEAMPEFLRRQVFGLVDATGAHPAMALATLLSGMAACAHGRYAVLRPNGHPEPLGLFMQIVSERTTGKSSIFREVYAPLRNARKRNYMYAHVGKPNSRSTANTEDGPHAKSQEEPFRFRERWLQDINKRGLLEALEGIGESASIATDEGETVLKSPLLRLNLAVLNEIFDGDCVCGMGRGERDAISALDSSLNVLIMAQPDIVKKFHEYHAGHARSIGFDARCLFACIPRVTPSPTSSIDKLHVCLQDYYHRAEIHLSTRARQLEAGEINREVLTLSNEAEALWWRLRDEHKQRGGWGFEHVQDAVDRMPQHALRIAGNIHAYCGDEGPIPTSSLNAAWGLARWFLAEFAFAFPPAPPALPPVPRMPKLSVRDKQLQRQQEDLGTVIECIRQLCQQLDVEAVPREKVHVRSGLYNARFRTAEMRAIDEGQVIETRIRKEVRLALAPGV